MSSLCVSKFNRRGLIVSAVLYVRYMIEITFVLCNHWLCSVSSDKSICLDNFRGWFYLRKVGGHSVVPTIII